MEYFTEAEQLERQLTDRLFKQAKITDYVLSGEGTFSNLDGYFMDEEGTKNWIEVKVRRVPRDEYSCYMMEKAKFAKMLPFYKTGERIWYINFFTEVDETYSAILFDLSSWCDEVRAKGQDINSFFFPIMTRTTTCANRGYESKEVTMLTVVGNYGKVVEKLNN